MSAIIKQAFDEFAINLISIYGFCGNNGQAVVVFNILTKFCNFPLSRVAYLPVNCFDYLFALAL